MECELYNQKLSAYLDRALSRRDAARVRAHVDVCERCREDLREIEKVRSIFRALSDPQPSPGFWNDTYLLIRQKAPTRRPVASVFHGLHYGFGATVAALLIALLVMVPRKLDHPHKFLHHTQSATTFVDPAALISLHTLTGSTGPLADRGVLRAESTEANSQDWAHDEHLNME